MNIKTKLKKGDIVDIFTDYQDEDINTFEGRAILLKKVRNGDSFYRKDEQLKIEEKKEYTKEERKRLEKYMRLKSFFYGSTSPPDKELVKLGFDTTVYNNCKDSSHSQPGVYDGFNGRELQAWLDELINATAPSPVDTPRYVCPKTVKRKRVRKQASPKRKA